MVRGGYIKIPIKAVQNEEPFHLNKIFIGKSGSDKSLDVDDARLVTVLLVGLARQ